MTAIQQTKQLNFSQAEYGSKKKLTRRDVFLAKMEIRAGADAGYVGVTKREEMQKKLQTMPNEVRWYIAKRRKPIREMAECWQKDLAPAFEKLKARIRAIVEHPFHIVKNIFKHKKVRYKGLEKNGAQLNVLFALGNLCTARGKLCP